MLIDLSDWFALMQRVNRERREARAYALMLLGIGA
jgi:hypothetical protein